MNMPVLKRSIQFRGHKTSVSLEDAFWRELQVIASRRLLTASNLVAEINDNRQPSHNLSSAIRLFVLNYYRSVADLPERSERVAGPGPVHRPPSAD